MVEKFLLFAYHFDDQLRRTESLKPVGCIFVPWLFPSVADGQVDVAAVLQYAHAPALGACREALEHGPFST
jgi:hypothetical protein